MTAIPESTEATKLVFACFANNVTQERFNKFSIEEQVSFAEGLAGLTVDGLIAALRYLARYHATRAAALDAYRQGHGHA